MVEENESRGEDREHLTAVGGEKLGEEETGILRGRHGHHSGESSERRRNGEEEKGWRTVRWFSRTRERERLRSKLGLTIQINSN